MRFKHVLMVCSVVAAGLACAAPPPPPADANPDEIIRKFAAKEAEFRKARENYTYRQSVKMEELDPDGNPQGKWEITSDIIFGPNKQRIEKVVYAPMITLRNLTLTPQDEQDLRNVQPFVLLSLIHIFTTKMPGSPKYGNSSATDSFRRSSLSSNWGCRSSSTRRQMNGWAW